MSNNDEVKDIKYKRIPKTLTVKSARNLTPNMRRVDILQNYKPSCRRSHHRCGETASET